MTAETSQSFDRLTHPISNSGVIAVRGARTHNLRCVDIDLPHHAIVVVTGPSGCGKSSLTVDTVFAEGQRQYLETLSAYSRQFINELPRPDVDRIDGLLPTIRIEQHMSSNHPRSTVATVSEVYDYLRVLLARAGDVRCHRCGKLVCQQTVAEIVENVMSLPVSTKFMILAPLVRGRRGHHREVLEQIRRERLVRVRVDGEVFDIDHCPDLNSRQQHDIEAVTDRLVMRPGIESRLREAIELAVRMTGRLVTVCLMDVDTVVSLGAWPAEKVFSTQLACPQCDVSYPEIEPRSFSFNSPHGMCPDCQGLGVSADGTICPVCQGSRIGPSGRAVSLGGVTVVELSQMSVKAALEWSSALESSNLAKNQLIARPMMEVRSRLAFLERVGLGYLTLGRGIDTLSGGEFQRVRLAAALGAGLTNTCMVLDEPSIGLHPRDTQRLIEIMQELRDVGNTLLVVEHDELIMRHADWLVDLGPGAGIHGGRVVAVGEPNDVARLGQGATALFLRGQKPIQRRCLPRLHVPDQWLELFGASGNNLKDVTLRMPLGALCAVTGVSGSGKSTLINQTLVPALQMRLGMLPVLAAPFRELRGGDKIQRVVMIDQSPIGRSGRSCPATYCGVFESLRRIFAATKDARRLGFSPSRFSFNSRQGACAVCRGNGQIRVSMKFLPDWFIVCNSCQGRRFNSQTLEIRFRGMSIADVLELTIEQAAAELAGFSKIHRVLKTLEETGLGYLRLGQPSTTLSGGEAQRMKLANELALPEQGQSLYVLDEPTTGLHPADVQNILELIDRLVASGNTVVVIEHHLDVIRNADWIIDLGPEGGEGGGMIVAEGPLSIIATHPHSHTGRCLQPDVAHKRQYRQAATEDNNA